ncbi:hypothetical protein EAG21025_43860 (plasmid) [Enterobacter asburiae]|uniref:hypothetical protein n=1 Tax=Enterobacter asburiae TaxID=61645 RepID=UPI0034E8A151|nr:hypothetical protein [Enterobacter asburiae]
MNKKTVALLALLAFPLCSVAQTTFSDITSVSKTFSFTARLPPVIAEIDLNSNEFSIDNITNQTPIGTLSLSTPGYAGLYKGWRYVENNHQVIQGAYLYITKNSISQSFWEYFTSTGVSAFNDLPGTIAVTLDTVDGTNVHEVDANDGGVPWVTTLRDKEVFNLFVGNDLDPSHVGTYTITLEAVSFTS